MALTLVVLGAARTAEASGCFLGPYPLTTDVAVGCPVVVLHHATSHPWAPIVTVRRDGQDLDVTGAIDQTTISLEVEYDLLGCDGQVESRDFRTEAYDRFVVTLADVQAGDVLFVDGIPAGTVQTSGACVVAEVPAPFCSGTSPAGCDEELPPPSCHSCTETVGCNAGGAAGAAGLPGLGLALLGLLARVGRRRARRSGSRPQR